MPKTETVYDSTDIQLRSLSDVASNKLTLEELAKPEIVQLMLERHVITLTDLKTARNNIEDLRTAVNGLTDDREKLRIDLAKSEQRQSTLFLEIPIGILSGFAINILTTNFGNGLGWALLLISLLMLLFLRLPEIRGALTRRKKENG